MSRYSSWSSRQLKAAGTTVNAWPLWQMADLLDEGQQSASLFEQQARSALSTLAPGWTGAGAASAHEVVTTTAAKAGTTASQATSASDVVRTFADSMARSTYEVSIMPAHRPAAGQSTTSSRDCSARCRRRPSTSRRPVRPRASARPSSARSRRWTPRACRRRTRCGRRSRAPRSRCLRPRPRPCPVAPPFRDPPGRRPAPPRRPRAARARPRPARRRDRHPTAVTVPPRAPPRFPRVARPRPVARRPASPPRRPARRMAARRSRRAPPRRRR